jgi:hypothetical protein
MAINGFRGKEKDLSDQMADVVIRWQGRKRLDG